MRTKGNHGLLCRQWTKLEELFVTVGKVSDRVAKFAVTRNKDNFFSPEDIQIGVNLQRLQDCMDEVVRSTVSIKILGKTELKWPDHDVSGINFNLDQSRTTSVAHDESQIFASSIMHNSFLPDLDIGKVRQTLTPLGKKHIDLNKSADNLAVPGKPTKSDIKPQNNNGNDVMRELFTGQTRGTIALPKTTRN